MRVGAQLALGLHDVGRDQQQPAGRRRRTGRTGRAPCRDMKPISAPTSAPLTFEPTPRRARWAALRSRSSRATTGSMDGRERVGVGLDPARRSTTRTGAVPAAACSPVKSRTSPVERRRPRAARRRRLGASPRLDLRARRRPAGRRWRRDVPVDHGRGSAGVLSWTDRTGVRQRPARITAAAQAARRGGELVEAPPASRVRPWRGRSSAAKTIGSPERSVT